MVWGNVRFRGVSVERWWYDVVVAEALLQDEGHSHKNTNVKGKVSQNEKEVRGKNISRPVVPVVGDR